jgi:hypothetical protein
MPDDVVEEGPEVAGPAVGVGHVVRVGVPDAHGRAEKRQLRGRREGAAPCSSGSPPRGNHEHGGRRLDRDRRRPEEDAEQTQRAELPGTSAHETTGAGEREGDHGDVRLDVSAVVEEDRAPREDEGGREAEGGTTARRPDPEESDEREARERDGQPPGDRLVGSEEAVPQVDEVAVDGGLAGGDARRVVEVVDARQEEVGVDLEVVAGDRRRIRLPPGVMAHRRVCAPGRRPLGSPGSSAGVVVGVASCAILTASAESISVAVPWPKAAIRSSQATTCGACPRKAAESGFPRSAQSGW